MPIIGRRWLQQMLNDVAPLLARAKKGTAKGLLTRLDSDDPDQSIPAEYELALTWGLSQLASIEIEKQIGKARPDIYSEDFLPGFPMVADVKAISDVALSDEGVMLDVRKTINQHCNGILAGAENHLHYTFMEESGYLPVDQLKERRSRYFRRRRVSRDFRIDDALDGALRNWLSDGPPRTAFLWGNKHIDVVIEWRPSVHPLGSVFCKMPSEAHDLKDNYLYLVLKEKRDQLAGASAGVSRVVLLGDAGCSLLRNLGQHSHNTVSGKQIIQAFLGEPENTVDFVVVFSPRRPHGSSCPSSGNPRIWHFDAFHRLSQPPEVEFDRFRALTATLPLPYLDGYQARSWHQQRMSDPKTRRDYLPLQVLVGRHHMTARLSARSLQDLIAGRLSKEQFELWATDGPNPFARAIEQGLTISKVSFEGKGLDEDDDYVVFEFSDDPAARELRLPKIKKDTTSRAFQRNRK